MSDEYLINENGQKLVVREPSVGDWYKLQKFVKSLRMEYDNFVSEFGDRVVGPFVIEGGYGLESANSIFEWLEQLKEIERSFVISWNTKVLLIYDQRNNEVVGILGLRFIHPDVLFSDIYGNIAMTIVPERRRFGIGTMVMNWVFENWVRLAEEFSEFSCPIKNRAETAIYMACKDYNLACKYFMESLGARFDCRYSVGSSQFIRYFKQLGDEYCGN